MLLPSKSLNSILSKFIIVCLSIAMLSLSSCFLNKVTDSKSSSSSTADTSSASDSVVVSSSIASSTIVSSSLASSSASSIVNPVQDVKNYLTTLSVKDMASGKTAINFIASNTSGVIAEQDKDVLLGLYLTFSYELAFAQMDGPFDQLNTMWETNPSSFNVLIAQSGLRTLEVEGSFVLVPDFTIILASMPGILSANGKTYCGLMVSLHNLEPIASESGILVPLEDLNKLQSEWSNFVTKLPASTVEFPPSDSTYKGHFEARKVLARLNSILGKT